MYSQIRSVQVLPALLLGLLLAIGAGRVGNAEGDAEGAPSVGRTSTGEAPSAAPTDLLCPGGVTLATALSPYAALDQQRSELEAALTRAKGAVQMFNQFKADHMRSQRVWGAFQATDVSVAAITALLGTLKTSANLVRDIAAEVDNSGLVKALEVGSSAIEDFVDFARNEESVCEPVNIGPIENLLTDPVPGLGTAKNLATNVCKTLEHQTQHAELVREHRQALGRLEAEVAKWSERARALRSQLATVESKRRGLERQCTEFTEQQRKIPDPRLVDFALADAERSRTIAAHQGDAAAERLAQSGAAIDRALQRIQSNAAQMSMQQQMRAFDTSRSKPTSNRATVMPSSGAPASTTSSGHWEWTCAGWSDAPASCSYMCVGGTCLGDPPQPPIGEAGWRGNEVSCTSGATCGER